MTSPEFLPMVLGMACCHQTGIAISLKSVAGAVFRLVSLAEAMALGKARGAQGKGIAKGAQRGTIGILGGAEGMLLGMQGFGLSGQFLSTSDEHEAILASIRDTGKFDQIQCCLFACLAGWAVQSEVFSAGWPTDFSASLLFVINQHRIAIFPRN